MATAPVRGRSAVFESDVAPLSLSGGCMPKKVGNAYDAVSPDLRSSSEIIGLSPVSFVSVLPSLL